MLQVQESLIDPMLPLLIPKEAAHPEVRRHFKQTRVELIPYIAYSMLSCIWSLSETLSLFVELERTTQNVRNSCCLGNVCEFLHCQWEHMSSFQSRSTGKVFSYVVSLLRAVYCVPYLDCKGRESYCYWMN